MHAWIKTQSVNLAAALTTLAIPLQLDKSQDNKSGQTFRTLLLSTQSLPTAADLGATLEGETDQDQEQDQDSAFAAAGPKINTLQMKKWIEDGTLSRNDPAHPVLDSLAALHNRECLVQWIKHGTRYCIARVTPGRDGLPIPRSILIKGEEPESIKHTPHLFRTGDIKIAAALARFGVPIIRLEGTADAHKFVLALHGHALVPAVPPVNALDHVTAYRRGTMAADDPFQWCVQALMNREAILDLIHRNTQLIFLRKPGSSLGAIVREDANSQCLDKVREHFRII